LRRVPDVRRALAAVPITAVLLLTGACGFDTLVTDDSSGGSDRCAWMRTSTKAGNGGTIVLFDLSNSTRAANAGDQVIDAGALLADVITHAVADRESVRLATFDGTGASVVLRETLATDSGAQNPDNQADDSATATSCLTDAVHRVADGPPGQPGSDVLGAIATAKEDLAQQPGAKNIVVVTDGITNVGCADLRNLTIGKDSEVDRVAAGCAARKPELRGYTLTMLGVGHPAPGQPLPGSGSLAWLNSLWSTMCTRMHADFCHVSTAPATVRTAGARVVASGVDDPVVTFPPDTGLARGEQILHVSSEVLFTNNDWTISPTGRAMLTAALDAVGRSAKIEVDGYTEAQASVTDNQKLAQHRADAVRQALLELGAGNVKAVGFPTTAPHCPGGTDEQARRCNRRVDIKVADG
jgi:OOP family OmpA-OmpF porin